MKKTIIQSLIISGLLLSCLTASAQKSPFYDRGYAGDIELGFLLKNYPYASITTTHGYCFGSGWFIGLGGAFETGLYPRMLEKKPDDTPVEWHGDGYSETKYPYEGDMMVKVYLDLRKTFYVKSTRLFADVKFGSPFNLAEPQGFGLCMRPSIGLAFGSHWSVSAGVDWSSYPYSDAGTDVIHPKQIILPYIGVAYTF